MFGSRIQFRHLSFWKWLFINKSLIWSMPICCMLGAINMSVLFIVGWFYFQAKRFTAETTWTHFLYFFTQRSKGGTSFSLNFASTKFRNFRNLEKVAKHNTREVKGKRTLRSRNLVLITECRCERWDEAPPRESVQRRRSIISVDQHIMSNE